MKLKDLVANSLPRVRGKKKKTGAVVAVATVPPSVPPVTDVVAATHIPGYDRNQNCHPTNGSRGAREIFIDGHGVAEASWRGNALYRGLERDKSMEVNSRMMASTYTASRGIVTSHSAEGFSSQLMMMSRSYDSRMAVSEYNGSCSQMSSISETGVEPYTPQQQYYHCHYHRHNHHHHYHHHHLHQKPMTPLAQNQQEMNSSACHVKYLGSYKSEDVPSKPEPGFFRKSFASFRSMRKHSSKANKDSNAKAPGTDQMRCSVCPYPETNIPERKSTEKRPAKPKRKGLKGFSRFKENKDLLASDKSDKSWYSDNDTSTIASPTIVRGETGLPVFVPYERSRVRECSVESCSSRLYGSREGSCAREVDPTGFDSASLSGYESDLPRGKVHRSRSRIKTNPWLPSPQPSLSGGRRADGCDLRESKEDIVAMEEQGMRVPRSASFEHQKPGLTSFHMPGPPGSMNRNGSIQRHRSLTPSDLKTTLSLDRATKSPVVVKKSTWWPADHPANSDISKIAASQRSAMNDLSSDAPRSRPTSIVSPNSEFVMLADNLEQLANNISFEYEDMLDSTLESVSVCQEDGQASIQELLTDEENGNAKKNISMFLKSDGSIHNAHSPDSGIGGLGSSDGDDAQTPGAQTELKVVSMDCVMTPRAAGQMGQTFGKQLSQAANFPGVNKHQDIQKYTYGPCGSSNSECQGHGNYTAKQNHSNHTGYRVQINPFKQNVRAFKCSATDDDSSATVSESDIDNTSYQDNSNNSYTLAENASGAQKPGGSPLLKCKTEARENNRNPALMVEERLDIQFQPIHRHFHGAGVVMGTASAVRDISGCCKANSAPLTKPCRYSDPTDAIPLRAARPNVLKTNPCVHNGARRLNNMEKGAGTEKTGRPWSDEFDFPRNITLIECVESPTENWQCDGQFSMCSSQDTVILEQAVRDANGNTEASKFENPNGCIQNEELIVKLDDNDAASTSQHTAEMASENTSLMDCNLDKLDTELHDTSFEMNDACVQTDFDEDFSRWDEVDTLDSLEENAIDPAESTRIWLLTGNMQGSADTGYSSLTRDSQIFMDEDTLFLAGELEERAAAERLSFGEYSNKSNNSDDRTPRNSAYLDLSFDTLPVSNDNRSLLLGEAVCTSTVSTNVETPIEDKNTKDTHVGQQGIPAVKAQPIPQQKSSTARAIPPSTVNQMFSNIETQFEEIFQQIHESDNFYPSTEAKRSSSDSSDSTLKSFNSTSPINIATSQSCQQSQQAKNSETGGRKASNDHKSGAAVSEQNQFEDHDYVNVPSSKLEQGEMQKYKLQKNVVSASALKDANGNVLVAKLRPKAERPSHFVGMCQASKRQTGQSSNTSSAQARGDVVSDRADYLEFLRDAPLDRSHLKRPLFLVPGVGPVDMSSSEQVNIFAPMSVPAASALIATSSPSMSPSSVHCGKKLKGKKGDQKRSGQPVCLLQSPGGGLQAVNSVTGPRVGDYARLPHVHTGKNEPKMQIDNALVPPPDSCQENTNGSAHELKHHKGFVHEPSSSKESPVSSLQTTPSSAVSSSSTSSTVTLPISCEELAQIDDVTRSLAERVMSLRREKDIVYRKIQEAQQDEVLRQEQKNKIQRHMHVQRKDALLETLHELRDRLEEQRRRLQLESSCGRQQENGVSDLTTKPS